MAITINSQISGQVLSATPTYCYLFEPLLINIGEDDLTAKNLYIDIDIVDTETGVVEDTLVKYVDFDINSGKSVKLDLMKVVRQHIDTNLYKIGTVNNILEKWDSIVSKYKYTFKIYSDKTVTQSIVRKLPIVGGRRFRDFSTLSPSYVTEFGKYGIDVKHKWKDFSIVDTILNQPSATDARPTNTIVNLTGEKTPVGFVIWKSRYGGWMYWGFDLRKKNSSIKYNGKLSVGEFESTDDVDGDIYVPTDYTSLTESYSVTLKSIGLTKEELIAVSGIESSPAIYYQEVSTDSLELMRLKSASVPLNSMEDGGDFTITLGNVSKITQKTI